MSKMKHEFEDNDFSEWGEYKKTSKKKAKHREQREWKFDKRKEYDSDDGSFNDDEDDYRISR